MKRNGRKAASGYSIPSPGADWVEATDNKDGTATVKVTANDSQEQRTAKIAVTVDGGKSVEVGVTQAGASEV